MKVKIKITDINTVDEIDDYWQKSDYLELLDLFNYPDAKATDIKELEELLHMAITDFEPAEAAQIMLNYKLGDVLNEGQINNMSHEMLEDKIAEEYPNTAIHYQLYNINQLLRKAYNGKFPNTEATIINLEFDILEEEPTACNKEIMLKILAKGLRPNNLIMRLFEEQLNGEIEFSDAQNAIWEIKQEAGNNFTVITSNYWIDKEDFAHFEYDSEIEFETEAE